MKLTKLTLCLATVALGIASAASSYTITLTSSLKAGDTQLKPGEYKLMVEGNQAIFKQGKTTTTVPVKVEQNANKYHYTALESDNSKLDAIELGGTNTKLVVSPTAAHASSAGGE